MLERVKLGGEDEKAADEREEALFQAALKLAAGARAEFLSAQCVADPVMRRRIEELLAAHDRSEHFMRVEDEALTATDPLANHEPAGQTIGRYTLLERLGEGGCGIVYVAEQTVPIRRRVALKLIKLGMDTRQVVARFEAERQVLAIMDHPNIAKVLDAGATGRGRPYFVMELVRGVQITHYCDQHRLSTDARLELFIQVCLAIQHAHQKGIIHRDIKPSNILLTLHDGAPVPKVIDFGIAKAIEGRLSDTTIYTQLHQLVGTPAYMSPEQAEMSGLDIDTRTDIYSLGVVLYELLVGRTPFNSKELLANGLDAMRKTIREMEPPRPSTCLASLDPKQIDSEAQRRNIEQSRLLALLRGDLDWIVMKCLEKDRSRRYESASALASDVRRHLNHEPVVARPPSSVYRVVKTVRRHRRAFAVAATLVFALVAGAITSVWLTVRAKRAEANAQIERNRAIAAERIAEAQSALAVAQRISAETSLYAADMNVVQEALAQNNLRRARERLRAHEPKAGSRDLRGWEWWYFDRLAHGDQMLVRPTEGRRAIFIGASRLPGHVLLGWEDGILELWPYHSSRRGNQVAMLTNRLESVVSDASGDFLATQSSSGTVGIWDQRDPTQLRLLHSVHCPGRLRAFCFRLKLLAAVTVPGGRWELPDSDHGTLSILDSETGREVARLAESGEHAAFSGTGAQLITGTWRGTAKTWKTSDFSLETVLPATGRAKHLALAPNDRTLLFSSFEGPVFFDSQDPRQTGPLNSRVNAAWPVASAFSPSGAEVAVAYGDGTIGLLNAATHRELRRLAGHETEARALTFSSDGKSIISADRSGESIRVFSSEPPNDSEAIDLLSSAVFSSDSRMFAVAERAADGYRSVLWNLDTREKRILLAEPNPLGFSSDNSILTTANVPVPLPVLTGKLTGVSHWNIMRGTVHRVDFRRTNEVGAVALSPDGKTFAAGDISGNVRLWDAWSGIEIGALESSSGRVWNLAFSPDGRRLAVGIVGDIAVWDLSARRILFQPRSGLGLPLAFSADGKTIAFSTENDIILHELDTERTSVLKGHRERLYWLAFSPDGRTLASAAEDLRVWSLAAGRDVASVRKPDHFLYASFSPDARTLIGGTVGKGYIWRASAKKTDN